MDTVIPELSSSTENLIVICAHNILPDTIIVLTGNTVPDNELYI